MSRSERQTDQSRRRSLLRWYDANARPLLWRSSPDSYRIWVAEVMLQQTRIAVVEPAYERFLEAFPTLEALATAEEEDVIARWSGLGYYSRARSLHRAARTLHEAGLDHFPKTWDEARRLPGVGPYTAAAVLSIAYDLPHAAVDGNVIRVLSRLERLDRPDARGEPHAALAERLLARGRAGDWNQAVMELGETVCLPRAPRCESCPLRASCRAYAADAVEKHPPPKQRRATEKLGLAVTVVQDRDGQLLLERGAFRHLDHLWLPPVKLLASPPPKAHFQHAILHRSFAVHVTSRLVSTRELRARAARGTRRGVERCIVSPADLPSLGHSSLLTKALRHSA